MADLTSTLIVRLSGRRIGVIAAWRDHAPRDLLPLALQQTLTTHLETLATRIGHHSIQIPHPRPQVPENG